MADLGALLGPGERHDWGTPPVLYDRCSVRWGPFDLDAAARADNARCARHITPEEDGLTTPWRATRVWLNPPYGRVIGRWVERAWSMPLMGYCERVVALLPARTDTRWWHDRVMRAAEVCLLRGRVRFVGAAHGAPFPSAIVVWDQRGAPPVWTAMDARLRDG